MFKGTRAVSQLYVFFLHVSILHFGRFSKLFIKRAEDISNLYWGGQSGMPESSINVRNVRSCHESIVMSYTEVCGIKNITEFRFIKIFLVSTYKTNDCCINFGKVFFFP